MWTLERFESELRCLSWPEMGSWEAWMRYALDGGGKRLRPRLAWESYAFYKREAAKWEEGLPLLLALELLHTFTLVHDDVMDRSALRRGRPTVYRETDENIAILVGDALLIAVYQQLAKLPPESILPLQTILSQGALRVCHGQLRDLELSKAPTSQVTLQDYLEMITEKTGALMGSALEAGAALAGAPPDEQIRLRYAGEAIGRYFQLQDDYLDAFSEESGKIRGGDLVEGKKTFLWLWAYESASPSERTMLEDRSLPPDKRREVGLSLYERLGLREKGAGYIESALIQVREVAVRTAFGPLLLQMVESLRGRKK
ncbi:MAG: polyprenyl synthetase family protein [Bacteroidia bacterium]|nr:polyprenyl synthetase family protein [Bacteroidia bacterium]